MFDLLVTIPDEQKVFLGAVRTAMQHYFGADQKRIDHALQVCRYVNELLAYIDAEPVLALTSAYLHDIGIHEAERRHGSNAGNWQELEGPPVAIAILTELGADASLIERVAEIVGKHHTSNGVDAPEFRILWDADAMVNFSGALAGKADAQIEKILHRHMVTEPGLRIARKLFMKDAESLRQWPTDN